MTVKMQVRRYGKYVFPFFLMLVAASFGYNTLRIVLTSRCQRSQCCGYFFIQFFIQSLFQFIKSGIVFETLYKADNIFFINESSFDYFKITADLS